MLSDDNIAISTGTWCDQATGLWQQTELVSELESDLRDILLWGRKCIVNFNAVKIQLFFVWPVQ